MFYFFLLYNLLILYLALHFKKKKYFSNYSGDSHQIFSNKKDIPLVGGIFLIMPILSISYHIYLYSLMIISILILGLLSDQKILSSAKKRFLFQIILILFSVVCLDLKILSSRIIYFDMLLEISAFNIFFTTFCLLILINGSNFIDGLNALLLIYMTTVIYILLDLNLKLLVEINETYILFLFMTLTLVIMLNITNTLMLGDAGAYVLSFFVGYLIILCHNSNPNISPYFFITLLWYPCFENLFSIIRKLVNNFTPLAPDNSHLHQLIYQKFNKTLYKNKLAANNASSILISLINVIILLFAARYPYETIYQIKIILISIFLYTLTFFVLNSKKSAK
tara:strand:+ start:14 stop:1024 length:1011 start_codon:yes stop_codon:yes gene_type:complete